MSEGEQQRAQDSQTAANNGIVPPAVDPPVKPVEHPPAAVETPINMAGSPSEGWVDNKWRPMMAWQYSLVCLFDFIVFPASTQIINWANKSTYYEWHSLTLQASGFYHLAMLGIVGAATYMRSKEKIASITGLP